MFVEEVIILFSSRHGLLLGGGVLLFWLGFGLVFGGSGDGLFGFGSFFFFLEDWKEFICKLLFGYFCLGFFCVFCFPPKLKSFSILSLQHISKSKYFEEELSAKKTHHYWAEQATYIFI